MGQAAMVMVKGWWGEGVGRVKRWGAEREKVGGGGDRYVIDLRIQVRCAALFWQHINMCCACADGQWDRVALA